MATQPDSDGWIEWQGGECPVEPDTLIEPGFRPFSFHQKAGFDVGAVERAASFRWNHNGRAGDIIAYRVVQV